MLTVTAGMLNDKIMDLGNISAIKYYTYSMVFPDSMQININ